MSKLYRTMIALFVAAAGLIGISGIPALKNADHGWKWILGGIGWFGGLLLALAGHRARPLRARTRRRCPPPRERDVTPTTKVLREVG
jgi:hypothetical protein